MWFSVRAAPYDRFMLTHTIYTVSGVYDGPRHTAARPAPSGTGRCRPGPSATRRRQRSYRRRVRRRRFFAFLCLLVILVALVTLLVAQPGRAQRVDAPPVALASIGMDRDEMPGSWEEEAFRAGINKVENGNAAGNHASKPSGISDPG